MKNVFEVGKPYLPARGLGEGVRFNIGADGAMLIYGFDSPTSAEVKAMKSGQPFEIRFITVDGIIWMLSKCGSLDWTDAPYNPRLSSIIPEPASITDGGGLGLTLVMLNSRDAVVKSVRLIGLGTDFSRQLLTETAAVRQMPMTLREAGLSINRTMMRYPTDRLIGMAKARFAL